MTVEQLLRLYAYSQWATRRLLEAAAALPPSALDERADNSSFGTLRGTISHLFGVEQMWLERWQGKSPRAPILLLADTPSDTIARWEDVWNGQQAYLQSHGASEITGEFAYRNQSGSTVSVGKEDMLVHLVNHGTYHRGQIAPAIRKLGGASVPTDFLLFSKDSAR